MKGLFVSDFLWLRRQIRTLTILLAVFSVFMLSDSAFFVVSFFPLLICVLCSKKIIFDLDRHTAPFLFTLPFDRNDYLAEKFCFILGPSILIELLLAGIEAILRPQLASDLLFQICATALMLVIYVSVIIPVFIVAKEKSSIALMVIGGLVCLTMTMFSDFDFNIIVFPNTLLVAGAIAAAAVFIISLVLSRYLLGKEQF